MCACPRPRIDRPYFKIPHESIPRSFPPLSVNWPDHITFFSHGAWNILLKVIHFTLPLKLYSRLDHFFVTAPLLYIFTSEINHITWLDHAPIELDIVLTASTPKTCHWRLNESLIKDPVIQTQLQQKLSEFFSTKRWIGSGNPPCGKPIRLFSKGECISAGSCLKRDSTKLKADLAQLEVAEMHRLESLYCGTTE